MNQFLTNQALKYVRAWVEQEHIPFSERAVQTRASAAMRIGEVDRVIGSMIMMDTGILFSHLRRIARYQSWWQKPDGVVIPAPQGHDAWAVSNGTDSKTLMEKGWGRGSGTTLAAYLNPTKEQMEVAYRWVADNGGDTDAFLFTLPGGSFPVSKSEVAAKGVYEAVQEKVQARQSRSNPAIGRVNQLASGGGGAYDQTDGLDKQPSYLETLNDGSTGWPEKSLAYMPQDFTDEVWWSRQILEKQRKNFPGKTDTKGPQPDAGVILSPMPTPIAHSVWRARHG